MTNFKFHERLSYIRPIEKDIAPGRYIHIELPFGITSDVGDVFWTSTKPSVSLVNTFVDEDQKVIRYTFYNQGVESTRLQKLYFTRWPVRGTTWVNESPQSIKFLKNRGAKAFMNKFEPNEWASMAEPVVISYFRQINYRSRKTRTSTVYDEQSGLCYL